MQQEMWHNAHKTRGSINLISYAGCVGISAVISAKIHSKCASQPEIAKNSLMLKVSYAACPGLSRMASAQFTLKMCIATWNREKFTKNPYFGGSKSFKVIDVGTTEKAVSSGCYDEQQVCLYM